ncbi:cupin, partial [Pseudomonas sp. SIMBA_044]
MLGCTSKTPNIQVEQLLKTGQSWDSTPYAAYPAGQPEITVLKITIPPHTAL